MKPKNQAERKARVQVILKTLDEMYQLLRHDQNTKDAVIVAISGYGQEEDRNRSKQAGFDHHLVKPISSDDLIKVLDNPR